MSKPDMALAARKFALNEAPVIAAGIVGSTFGTPVVGAIASASMRSAITIGKKIKATTVKHKSEHASQAMEGAKALSKVAESLGAKSINELKSAKFQRKLESDFIGDLAFGAIDMAVSAIVPLPMVGSAIALKTSGMVGKFADNLVQKFKKQRLAHV